jgi:hypothetical protein
VRGAGSVDRLRSDKDVPRRVTNRIKIQTCRVFAASVRLEDLLNDLPGFALLLERLQPLGAILPTTPHVLSAATMHIGFECRDFSVTDIHVEDGLLKPPGRPFTSVREDAVNLWLRKSNASGTIAESSEDEVQIPLTISGGAPTSTTFLAKKVTAYLYNSLKMPFLYHELRAEAVFESISRIPAISMVDVFCSVNNELGQIFKVEFSSLCIISIVRKL